MIRGIAVAACTFALVGCAMESGEFGDDPATEVADTTEAQHMNMSRGWTAPAIPRAEDQDGVKRILAPIHNPNPAWVEKIERVRTP